MEVRLITYIAIGARQMNLELGKLLKKEKKTKKEKKKTKKTKNCKMEATSHPLSIWDGAPELLKSNQERTEQF